MRRRPDRPGGHDNGEKRQVSEVSGLFAETIDGPTLAAEAGLRYIDDEIPGYCRIGRGRGFSYHTSRGGPARDSEVERFRSLAIPPAWKDVWIAPSPEPASA